MEFLEDNPNFEINLQNDEENKKTNKKTLKSIKYSGLTSSKNSSNNSPKKQKAENFLINDFNIAKQNINLIKTPQQRCSREIFSENSITHSPTKSNNSSKILNLIKIKKTQKINNILGGLKSKNSYHLSPNTNLKLFGDLYPGPGQYYNPKANIGQSQNLRYNNLYIKETEPNLSLKYKIIKDFYYNSKVGPGSYNPDNNFTYKSYSQNPKIFISQLERGPLFKINDTIGPGQYNLSKDLKKDSKSNLNNHFKKPKNLNINNGNLLSERNYKIFNTFNNNNYENILNSKNGFEYDNKLKQNRDKFDEKKNRGNSGKKYIRGTKNFSWERVTDFSGINIKYNEKENNNIMENDIFNYKRQNFNFENQFKLNQEKNKFNEDATRKIQREIERYNKLYIPLIQNVQRDISLKGNHLPGPCYYKYANGTIEGDLIKLNKKNKNSSNKNWK